MNGNLTPVTSEVLICNGRFLYACKMLYDEDTAICKAFGIE